MAEVNPHLPVEVEPMGRTLQVGIEIRRHVVWHLAQFM
jgi:hypothetical protein